MDAPFWKTKPLEAMSPAEWESLCDGCGKCCMAKLEDEDTGEIYWTTVGCRLFDAGVCRCTDYEHRLERVDDCVQLTPENVRTITWLPSTCGYRLVAEGKDLFWWHPLVSGRRRERARGGHLDAWPRHRQRNRDGRPAGLFRPHARIRAVVRDASWSFAAR